MGEGRKGWRARRRGRRGDDDNKILCCLAASWALVAALIELAQATAPMLPTALAEMEVLETLGASAIPAELRVQTAMFELRMVRGIMDCAIAGEVALGGELRVGHGRGESRFAEDWVAATVDGSGVRGGFDGAVFARNNRPPLGAFR